MSPAEKALRQRIQRQAKGLHDDAARRLLAAYNLIRAQLTDAEILRALRTGALDRLLNEALNDRNLDAAFSSLRASIDRETLRAGQSWHRFLPSRIRVGAAFDVLNPRVIDAVRRLDTRAIEGLKAEVRESVRQAAREGLEAGKNPRVVANRIGDAIGLPPNYERAVARFRSELESGDRAALRRVLGRGTIRTPDGTEITRSGHAGGKGLGTRDLAMLDRMLGDKPLTPKQVERMTEAYRKRLLALNTEAHARSIALDSQRLAQRNSWQSAIDRGIVDVSRLQRTRVEVMDTRTRPSHRLLHGETVGFNQPYSNGEMVAGESEYGCRAIERFTLVALARAA